MGAFEIDPYFGLVYILYNLIAAPFMYLMYKEETVKDLENGESPDKKSGLILEANQNNYMLYGTSFMLALLEALPKMSYDDEISVTPKQLFWIRHDPRTQSYSRDLLALKKQHAGMFMGHPIIVRRATEGES